MVNFLKNYGKVTVDGEVPKDECNSKMVHGINIVHVNFGVESKA